MFMWQDEHRQKLARVKAKPHTMANDFLHSLSCRDLSNGKNEGDGGEDPTGLDGLT